MLVLIPQADAMLLDNIAVARSAQGRGHGKRLMAWAEDQARAAGLPRMRLYTHEKMAANIALYARAGYVEIARVTERGLNRVYMEKSARPARSAAGLSPGIARQSLRALPAPA